MNSMVTPSPWNTGLGNPSLMETSSLNSTKMTSLNPETALKANEGDVLGVAGNHWAVESKPSKANVVMMTL